MPTHAEQRKLSFTPRQMFDLVADIDRYPEFLPWCVAARVNTRQGNVLTADLVIGFKMLRERFTSKVTLDPYNRIDVTYLDGPFKFLNNQWLFEPAPDGGTIIHFHIDFEFRSKMLQALMGTLFNEAVRRMVAAFERRAEVLYGTKS